MIPTVVIVNDDNPLLIELADKFKTKLRVVKRSSLDGEKLYGATFFEGVLYFDESGSKQLIRQDIYEDTYKAIEEKLKLVSAGTRLVLEKYLAPFIEDARLKEEQASILEDAVVDPTKPKLPKDYGKY